MELALPFFDGRVRGGMGAANGPTRMLALDFERMLKDCVAKKHENK